MRRQLTAWPCLALILLSACSGGDDGPAAPGDPSVPRRVIDLTVTAGGNTSVTLAWTAPAASAKSNPPLRYDLRYTPLGTEDAGRDAWAQATPPLFIAGAGEQQVLVVAGLQPGATYVFSLAASFNGSDWSEVSPFAVGTAAVQFDMTAPAAVTDLVQYAGSAGSVTVAWTAAGDDSVYGRASSYDVRYATEPLTPANWSQSAAAPGIPGPHPNPAKLILEITGLSPDTRYHVGVAAHDDSGHRSGLSNNATVTTSPMRTLYVDLDGAGDYPSIEEAIHAAVVGDVVLVGPGRYTWTNQGTGDPQFGLINVERDQTDFTVVSEGGAAVTILDAELKGPVMSITGGYSGPPENPGRAGITVDGFTFTNGLATGPEGVPGEAYAGAGIVIHLSDTVVRNCIFTGNKATQGGAVWSGGQGSTVFENCLIEHNTAELGGGIMLINSEPVITIRGCVIRDNLATQAGGGIFAINVGLLMEGNLVVGNTSGDKGGGISVSGLHPGSEVTGCTVIGNRAPQGAAVRVVDSMMLRVTSCLLAFNLRGAAFSAAAFGGVEMGCSVVFGNEGGDQNPSLFTDLGGNLAADPLLCEDGLSPAAASVCLPENRPGSDGCGLIGALDPGCSR